MLKLWKEVNDLLKGVLEMADGWVKLHRCLLDKAIWKKSKAEQKAVLITVLLLANHKNNEW